MSTFAAFVLGLIIGWIIEWIIDWVYWRRGKSGTDDYEARLKEQLMNSEKRELELKRQLEQQTTRLSGLQEQLNQSEARGKELESQLVLQGTKRSDMQKEISGAETDPAAASVEPNLGVNPGSFMEEKGVPAAAMPVMDEPQDEMPAGELSAVRSGMIEQDDLIIIKGIGPVIAKKLNEAGIYSFADLAATTPEHLREMVGDMISRLANEEEIIDQAKKLAADKKQGG